MELEEVKRRILIWTFEAIGAEDTLERQKEYIRRKIAADANISKAMMDWAIERLTSKKLKGISR